MLSKDARIYFYMRSRGYGHEVAEWLVKQSIWETRFEGIPWNSPAARNDKNLWGMGRVSTRPTTQISARPALDGTGQNTIGAYTSEHDSTRDRVLFDKWYLPKYIEGAAKVGVVYTPRQIKTSLAEYRGFVNWTPYNASPTYAQTMSTVKYSAEKFRVWISVALVGVTATVLFILWKKKFKKS